MKYVLLAGTADIREQLLFVNTSRNSFLGTVFGESPLMGKRESARTRRSEKGLEKACPQTDLCSGTSQVVPCTRFVRRVYHRDTRGQLVGPECKLDFVTL